MRSLVSRAKSVYDKKGAKHLFYRGLQFTKRRFYEHIVWGIFPKKKTLRTIASSRLLTSFYFLLKGTFYREQRAVLCGAAEYNEAEEQREAPRHRIIRSTHRIEKGLSMPEDKRRPVFAERYIRDLVDDLRAAWEPDQGNEQLQWAVDVLSEYFERVERTPIISAAEDNFKSFLSGVRYEPQDKVPFPRSEINQAAVSPEAMRQLAQKRTSTRWFQQRDVPRDLIDESLKVAMQSPSACNRQSYEFRFFDDPELIEEISSLAIGADGYNDNIPCLAVIVGKQRAYFNVRDKHVIYIDASLAAMAFQFSLETHGLASCCINWPAIPKNERQISKKLNLNCDEKVIMLMAIGYPDPNGMIPYSKKKPVDLVRSFNEV